MSEAASAANSATASAIAFVGASSIEGYRPFQEDKSQVWKITDEDLTLIGVYDGHGGAKVSSICADPETGILNRIYSHPEFKTDIKKAIHETMMSFDQYLRDRDDYEDFNFQGTTVVIGIIHDGKIFMANVGDSRGVFTNSNGDVFHTVDHEPDSEVERINAAGGYVINNYVQGDQGNLNLSRAIGDNCFKVDPRKTPDSILEESVMTEQEARLMIFLGRDCVQKIISYDRDVINYVMDMSQEVLLFSSTFGFILFEFFSYLKEEDFRNRQTLIDQGFADEFVREIFKGQCLYRTELADTKARQCIEAFKQDYSVIRDIIIKSGKKTICGLRSLRSSFFDKVSKLSPEEKELIKMTSIDKFDTFYRLPKNYFPILGSKGPEDFIVTAIPSFPLDEFQDFQVSLFASDGLFKVTSNEQALKAIYHKLQQGKTLDVISRELCDEAIHSGDNITCVIVLEPSFYEKIRNSDFSAIPEKYRM